MATMTHPAAKKNIVILGGSYAGISTAHYVLKHVVPQLVDPEDYRLVLISKSTQTLCRPACPRAMISDSFFDQEKLFVDVASCFKSYPAGKFQFLHGTATAVDFARRFITVESGREVSFHALIITTGASTPSPLMGLTAGATDLREVWEDFRAALPNARSIVIAGGGPAGVETAAELVEYTRIHHKAGKETKVTLVTSGSELLPALRPSIARQAERYLSKSGVTIVKNTKVQEPARGPAPRSRTKVSLSNGDIIEADLYIPATGTTPNASFISDQNLLRPDGRIETDTSLRVTKAGDRVYAIGDVSSFARPAIHNIFAAVPVLCTNLKRDMVKAEGREPSGHDRVFEEDERETQMVLLGHKKGVGATMGWYLPSFVVRMIKRDYWLWTTPKLWSGAQWAKETA